MAGDRRARALAAQNSAILRGGGSPSDKVALQGAIAEATNDPMVRAAFRSLTYFGASSQLATKLSRRGCAIWGMVGDSLAAGFGAGVETGNAAGTNPEASPNSKRSRSMPTQLAPLLKAAGIPTRADALCCTGFIGVWSNVNVLAYNSQISAMPAAWTAPSGGRYFTNSTDTSSFVWAPTVAADTFDLILYYTAGNATITVTDASGTLATIDCAVGGTRVAKVSVTRAQASTLPISIQRTGTGGAAFIMAILPSLSFAPMLEIVNMGIGGTKASDWILEPLNTSLPKLIAALDADLYTIQLGANDAFNGDSAATFSANMGTLIDYTKAAGDTFLIKPNKTSTALGTGYDVPASYLAAYDTLTASKGLGPSVDFNSLPRVQADYFDLVHLSAQGYGKEAVALAAYFVSA